MKRLHYITFVLDPIEAKSILTSIGLEKTCNLKDKLQAVELYEDTQEFEILTKQLSVKDISYDSFVKEVYSDEELSSSEFFYFYGGELWGFPQPESGYLDECFDSTSKCVVCNNGATQNRPISLKSSPPKRIGELFLVNWIYEFVVSDRIAKIISNRKLSGLELWPIYSHKRKKEIPGWKQLYFTNTLPPMSPQTHIPEVIEDEELLKEFSLEPLLKCDCGKCGYNIPEKIIYSKSCLDNFRDFNKSSEWLGGGAATYPIKIVSKEFYQIILDEKVQNVTFIPIIFS